MNVYYAAHSFSFDARWFKWQWPCQVKLVLGTVLGYSIGSHSHHYANKSYCCQLRPYVSWILITPLFTYWEFKVSREPPWLMRLGVVHLSFINKSLKVRRDLDSKHKFTDVKVNFPIFMVHDARCLNICAGRRKVERFRESNERGLNTLCVMLLCMLRNKWEYAICKHWLLCSGKNYHMRKSRAERVDTFAVAFGDNRISVTSNDVYRLIRCYPLWRRGDMVTRGPPSDRYELTGTFVNASWMPVRGAYEIQVEHWIASEWYVHHFTALFNWANVYW